MSLATLRAEFGMALADFDEARVYTATPATPEMPCIIVGWPKIIEFNQTLGGLARYELGLTVLVSMSDVERAEIELDSILTGGLRAALYDHASSVWNAFFVESVTNIRPENVGNAAALAADINVVLLASADPPPEPPPED